MGRLISGKLVVGGATLWTTSPPRYVVPIYRARLRLIQGLQNNQKRVLFDVAKDGAKLASKSVVPEDQQESNESRKLWMSLTEAITQ
jgi:hypothetical protein